MARSHNAENYRHSYYPVTQCAPGNEKLAVFLRTDWTKTSLELRHKLEAARERAYAKLEALHATRDWDAVEKLEAWLYRVRHCGAEIDEGA